MAEGSRTCTNCGIEIAGEKKHCARVGCVERWNERIHMYTDEKLATKLSDGRVFATEASPLCWRCFTLDGYTCWHCNLAMTMEA